MIGRRVAAYGGATRRWTRRVRPAGWVPRKRWWSTGAPGSKCPPTKEAADAEREGVRINWLRTITAFEGTELQVEVMELDESGYPRPTGRFESLGADSVILALGQETELASCARSREWNSSGMAPYACPAR